MRAVTASRWLHLAALASAPFVLLFLALQALAQDSQMLSRSVTITTSPPSAMVWMKVGTTLTCTNVQTPGTVEFKFHGVNDVQRIRLRKFGYKGRNLDIRASDDRADASLGDPAAESFVVSPDAKPELKQLNDGLQKEFQKTIFADPDVFRCVPFELGFVELMDDQGDLTLGLGITLDRAFGGSAFRVASHAGRRDVRRQELAQAVLAGGIADLFARLRRIATTFPNIKTVTILCTYPSSETYLDTEKTRYTTTLVEVQVRTVFVYDVSSGRSEVRNMPAAGVDVISASSEVTKVKDRDVERVLKLVMPVAEIPDTLDKKAISNAVLAKGKISLAE